MRVRRKVLNLSQAVLAGLARVSTNEIGAFERGANRVPPATLAAIALILEVPVAFFFEGAEELHRRPSRLAKTLDHLQTDNEAELLGRFADLPQQLRKRLLDLVETLASDAESSED
jgi:hypothetical protein